MVKFNSKMYGSWPVGYSTPDICGDDDRVYPTLRYYTPKVEFNEVEDVQGKTIAQPMFYAQAPVTYIIEQPIPHNYDWNTKNWTEYKSKANSTGSKTGGIMMS